MINEEKNEHYIPCSAKVDDFPSQGHSRPTPVVLERTAEPVPRGRDIQNMGHNKAPGSDLDMDKAMARDNNLELDMAQELAGKV